jgi:hypothetical protein
MFADKDNAQGIATSLKEKLQDCTRMEEKASPKVQIKI